MDPEQARRILLRRAEAILARVRSALLTAVREGRPFTMTVALGWREEGPDWRPVRVPDGSEEIVVRVGPRP